MDLEVEIDAVPAGGVERRAGCLIDLDVQAEILARLEVLDFDHVVRAVLGQGDGHDVGTIAKRDDAVRPRRAALRTHHRHEIVADAGVDRVAERVGAVVARA